MKSSFIKVIVILSVSVFGAGGCREKEASGAGEESASEVKHGTELAWPVKGVWAMKNFSDLGVLYVIDLDEPQRSSGTISVERNGVELRRHKFDVVDVNTIHIRGSERRCPQGEMFTGKEIVALMTLERPPKVLWFGEEASGSDGGDHAPDELYLYGLFLNKSRPSPIPLSRASEDTRFALPFDANLDWHVTAPPGAQGSIGGDGAWGVFSLKFKTPVHPIGYVRSLRIGGYHIPLEDGTLRDGMLRTKDLGELELLLTAPTQGEVRATRRQLRTIAAIVNPDWTAGSTEGHVYRNDDLGGEGQSLSSPDAPNREIVVHEVSGESASAGDELNLNGEAGRPPAIAPIAKPAAPIVADASTGDPTSRQTAQLSDVERLVSSLTTQLTQANQTISQANQTIGSLRQENAHLKAEIKALNAEMLRLMQKNAVLEAGHARTSQGPVQLQGTEKPKPETGLKGNITRLDLQNKLAEISIGSTSGVKVDMKFHILRGNQVVADMLVLDVEPDRAVGTIQIIQQGLEPGVDDLVSTNL